MLLIIIFIFLLQTKFIVMFPISLTYINILHSNISLNQHSIVKLFINNILYCNLELNTSAYLCIDITHDKLTLKIPLNENIYIGQFDNSYIKNSIILSQCFCILSKQQNNKSNGPKIFFRCSSVKKKKSKSKNKSLINQQNGTKSMFNNTQINLPQKKQIDRMYLLKTDRHYIYKNETENQKKNNQKKCLNNYGFNFQTESNKIIEQINNHLNSYAQNHNKSSDG